MAYINEGKIKAKDNITPEERLLKIIESPGIQKARVYLSDKAKAINIKNVISWIKGFRFDKNIIKKFDLRRANKAVAFLCGFITLFWIFDFVRVSSSLGNRFQKTLQTSNVTAVEEKNITLPMVNIEEVQVQAKRRNMFTFLPTPVKAEAGTTPEISALIVDLKLVGIIWSNSPQAMIENTKEQRTFLLSQGEQIGQVTVKKIFQEKVILEVGGEEQELR